ncbi:hypothetical protein [Streptomyces alfalfae]
MTHCIDPRHVGVSARIEERRIRSPRDDGPEVIGENQPRACSVAMHLGESRRAGDLP